MEVDQDLPAQGTPPGTPFEDDFTPSTTRGHTTTIPVDHTHTNNYYTPLNTENQEADPSNDAANQQPLTHGDPRTAGQTAAEEAATGTAEDADAEAAAAAGAAFTARLAAEREAAEAEAAAANEAAAAAALQADAAPTGGTVETTAETAAAAEAAKRALEAAAAVEAEKNRLAALKAAKAAKAAQKAIDKKMAAAAAAAKAKGKQAMRPEKGTAVGGNTGNTSTAAQHTQDTIPPNELDDWELSEGGLPAGSTLSGSKALLEDPPGDEADSREHKRTNTGTSNAGNHPPTA
jgi:hypothetical protein